MDDFGDMPSDLNALDFNWNKCSHFLTLTVFHMSETLHIRFPYKT